MAKANKKIVSCEQSSSDESEIADEHQFHHGQLYSRTIPGDNNKGSPRKFEIELKRPSSKSPAIRPSLKKNIGETSTRVEISKEKAYKSRVARKESFSDKSGNVCLSPDQTEHLYSRVSKNEDSKESHRKLERKRSSTSISPEKSYFAKTNVDETVRRTRRSTRITYKRINYCEDDSSDESDNTSRNRLYSRPVGGDKLKEAPCFLTTTTSKNKMGINYNKIYDSKDSSDDLYIDVTGLDSDDNAADDDKFLTKSSDSVTSPDRLDLSESGSFSPFRFWGKSATAMKHSEDEDVSESYYGACAKKIPKLVNKNNAKKEWEKFKAIKIQQDNKANPSVSKTGDADRSSSSFQDHENETSEFIESIRHSEGEWEQKEHRKEVECGTNTQTAPKVISNKAVKELEMQKSLKKPHYNKEGYSESKGNDFESGSSLSFHNQRNDPFKLTYPVRHSEGDIEYKSDSTGLEDCPQARNEPEIVNYDNRVKKDLVKIQNKQLDKKKEPSGSKSDDTEPEDSFKYWWKTAFFKPIKSIHSEDNIENKRDGKIEDPVCARNAPKVMNKYDKINPNKIQIKQLDKKKETNVSNINDGDLKSLSLYYEKNSFKIVKLIQSEDNMANKKDCKKAENPDCARNAPKLVNKCDVKKDSCFVQNKLLDNQIEPNGSKTDDAELGSMSLHYGWKNDFKPIKPNNFEGDTKNKKISSKNDLVCVRNKDDVENGSEKYEVLSTVDNKNVPTRSKTDDAVHGSSTSFHYQRKSDLRSIISISHIKGDLEHEKNHMEVRIDTCAQNASKIINESNAGNETEKLFKQKKELGRFKIKDDEDTDKALTTHEGSNENMADLNFSPLAAENKGLKRRSDPNNAFKENRPRPSF